MESLSSSFFSRQRTHFWMLVFACLLLYCNPSQKTKTISVDLYPKSGTELWGFVNLAIVYGSLNNLPIKSISYDTGTVSIPVLKIDNPLRSEPGVDEISFCAKCITASKVNITVEFTDEANHEPIRKTYTINHMPVLKITSEELPNGQLLLDAGSSTDPEGKTLTFKWHVKNEIITGTTCRVNKDSLIKNPLLLSVSDGLAYGEELITSDAITNERIYTSEKLACTKMEIITTGNSLLNGEK